jgi:tellurite resistance protein
MFGKLKEKLAGGAQRMNGKTDLLESICAACVLVGAADGDLSDDEATVALDRLLNHETISVAFSATQIEQAFDKQVKRAKQGLSGRIALRREIEEAKSKSTADDLEMILVIAIDVASADGDIGDKEMGALKTIGQAVGIDPARYLA